MGREGSNSHQKKSKVDICDDLALLLRVEVPNSCYVQMYDMKPFEVRNPPPVIVYQLELYYI